MREVDYVKPQWSSLIKIGGVTAIIAALLGIIEVTIEISGSSLTSAPTTVLGWFTLLQNDRLLGLSVLGIFETVFFPLSAIMFLAFYPTLKRISQSLVIIAFILNLIGTVAYLATNAALSMDSLSSQYFAATTDAQRSMLLAAGQAVLATSQGTGSNIAFVLGSTAGLLVSIAMLRSKIFGKPVAIIGIVGNTLGLPGAALGPILWSINGLLMLIWLVGVGAKLLQFSGRGSDSEAIQ